MGYGMVISFPYRRPPYLSGPETVWWGTYLELPKRAWAVKPDRIGKMAVLTNRINVNRQPRIPTSMSNLLTANRDHPVIKATIVPMLASERRSPAQWED